MTQAEHYESVKRELLSPVLDNHIESLVAADSKDAAFTNAWAIADWVAENPGLSGGALASVIKRFPTDEQGDPILSGHLDSLDAVDLGLAPSIAIVEIITPQILDEVVTDAEVTTDFIAALDEVLDGADDHWLKQHCMTLINPLLSTVTPANCKNVYAIATRFARTASSFAIDALKRDTLEPENLSQRPDLAYLSHFLGQIGLHDLSTKAQDLAPPPPGPFAATPYNTFHPSVNLSRKYYESDGYKAALDNPDEWEAWRKVAVLTTTWIFREPNIRELCEYVCPELAREQQSPLRIVQVACSYGYEALGLEVLLSKQNIDHTIRGLDINAEAVERAQEIALASLNEQAWTAYEDGRFVSLFEKGDEGLSVPSTMAERMQFAFHDILAEPLPEDSADVIIVNNMLPYYTDTARSQILSNMLAGLRDGGIFTFEGGRTATWCHVSGYSGWADSLSRFGLNPFSDDEERHHNVLRYTRW